MKSRELTSGFTFAGFDPNGDGQVTVADVFYLINTLFAGGPALIAGGDADGDGQVNAGDIFYAIGFLFAGGPAPKELPAIVAPM